MDDWEDDPVLSQASGEQEFGDDKYVVPRIDIQINSRSKNNTKADHCWSVDMCRDALIAATSTKDSSVWSDICKKIAT